MAAPPLGPTLEEQLAKYQLGLRATEQQCDALKSEAALAASEARGAQAALAAAQAEAGAAAALARRTLAERELELRELRGAHEALQARYATDTSELRAAASEERLHLEGAHRAAVEELRLQLQEARFQVERGTLFMDQKATLEAQVDALQVQLAAEASRSLLQTTEMERRFIAEKLGMARTLDLARDTIEHTAKQAALATLQDSQRRVLVQNEGMGSEIVHLSVQTRKLTRSITELGLVRGALQREVKDLRSAEEVWAERCARLSTRCRALEARLAEVEGGAAAAQRAHAEALAALRSRVAKETEELRLEALGLRSLLVHRERELATVKRLAGTVLAQRTEVEHFFLDALALVKMEVLRRRRSAEAAAAAAPVGSSKGAVHALKSSRGPASSSSSSSSSSSTAALDAGVTLGLTGLKPHQQYPTLLMPAEGVDLLDLAAEDRERVLWALFRHLQQGEGGQPQASPRQPPQPLAPPPPPPPPQQQPPEQGQAEGLGAAEPQSPLAGEQVISRPIGVLAELSLSP